MTWRGMAAGAMAVALLLAACGGPAKAPEPALDAEYARLEASARGAFERGQLEYARELYRRLLVQAQRSDDAHRIGDAAFNLAACGLALGDAERARALLDEAALELARAEAPTAAVFVLRARLEYGMGETTACVDAAGRALTPEARASDRERVEALAVRGLAELDLGNAEVVHATLDELRGQEEVPSVAQLAGRLALHEGRFADAARSFDAQAQALQAASRYRFMSSALEDAGEAWLAAGEAGDAADRLMRAARSRFANAASQERPGRRALQDLLQAAELCQRVVESGGLEEQPQLAPRLARLVQEIETEREELEALLSVIEVGG